MAGARRLEYRVLGPLEVLVDGSPVGLGGPKPRALLAVLLVHRNEVVSVDRLIDALWGETPPRSASTMLHGYVSKLRKALDGEGGGGAAEALATTAGGYRLRVGPGELDLALFERLVEQSARVSVDGSSSGGAEALRRALALWRGPPFADIAYEPALQDEIRRLDAARLDALGRRIDADLAAGHDAELVPELEALAHRHPLDERLQGQLMVALSRSGRPADALEVYRRLRRRLAEELGLEPDPELTALQAAILRRESGLRRSLGEDGPAGARAAVARRSLRARRTGAAIAAGLLVAGGAVAGWAATRGAGDHAVPVRPNSVAIVDPRTNRVVGDVDVGSEPIGPVTDGRVVWTASAANRTVSRIELEGGGVTTTGIGMTPWGLAAAGGSVWASASDSLAVERLDARFATVELRARVPGTLLGGALAATPKALWLARRSELLRALDPRTGRVMRAYAAVTNGDAVAADSEGAWVGTAGASVLAHVDAETGAVTWTPVAHSVRAIAVGFGSLWVIMADDDRVWRLDPHTLALRSTIRVGHDPGALAVDPDGRSLWVANTGSGTVSRIDPYTGRVAATVVTGQRPSGLVVAGGRLWVAVRPALADAGAGSLRRLRTVASIRTGEALGLTYDVNAVWVVERREGRLARIDPATDRVVTHVFTGPAQEPASGPGGIWVPSWDTSRLLLVDPSRNRVVARVNGRYLAVASGEGQVWALTREPGRLDRIDPGTRRVIAHVPLPANTLGVAIGGGAVWACGGDLEHPRTPGWIWRVDPRTNHVVARIRLPRLVRKLAFGFRSLWATLHGAVLYRIDPAGNEVVARIRTSKGGAFDQDYVAIGRTSVWVTNLNNAADAELVEVDPQTNRPVSRTPLLQGPAGVIEAFGSIWVPHFGGARVLRLEPARRG